MPRNSDRPAFRHPLLAGAVILFVLFAGTGGIVASVGSSRVAETSLADRVVQAEDALRRDLNARSSRVAEEVRIALDGARRASEMLAREAAISGSAESLPPPHGSLEPVSGSTRALHASAATGVFAVAPPGIHVADPALLAWAEALAPVLRASTGGASGVARAWVSIDGAGLVGAPDSWTAGDSADSHIAALDEESVSGSGADRWSDAHAGSVVHSVPVVAGDGRRIGTAYAAVDRDDLVRRFGNVPVRTAWTLVASDGRVIASTPGAAVAVGAPEGSGPWAVSAALHPLLGGDGVFYPGSSGHHATAAGRRIAAAGVRDMPYAVAWIGPDEPPVLAPPDAVRAAERFGWAVFGLSIVLGAACLLGAAALARVQVGRVRHLVQGAEMHQHGAYDHRVPVAGDDEIADIGRWMNAAASRLRNALGRVEEGERRLSNLIESMGDGFATADVDDRIVYVNQRFADLLRRPAASLNGRYVEELLQPDSLDRCRTQWAKLREGRPVRFEASWAAGQAQSVRTIVSGMPLFDGEGRPAGVYVVVTDLTDRVRVHEEVARAEKVRALAEMAGGVAHDFNNVLTVILGNAQYMMLEELPPEARETLAAIERAAMEGTETVRRIREFSRARTVPLTAEPISVNDVVDRVVDAARRRFEGRDGGAGFRVVVERDSRRRVRCNPDELREALANIVENAFDAMPQGGTLTVATFDRGEDAVAIRIEDTGVGIPAENAGKIFDPFYTTKPGGRCVGLGLSIAFGIVRAHRGRIDLRSQLGRGSTFTIVLPAAAEKEPTTGSVPPAAPEPARIEPRVLLVGGDPSDVQPLLSGLRNLGMYAACVHPASALALASDRGIFNTLAIELELGGSSGWELARQARAARPDLRILLLTTPGHPVSETQARNAGIDRVLVRPFDVRDVHAEVFALLASPRELAAPPAPASKRARRSGPKQKDANGNTKTSEIWGAGSGPPAEVAPALAPLADGEADGASAPAPDAAPGDEGR